MAYGTDPSQWAELHRPSTVTRPGVVVIVHGGFWSADYGADLGDALAAEIARRGVLAWNVEYRRLGNGGGWPATFADVSSALDALADQGLTGQPVVTLGHSSGGHLAVWAAGPRLFGGHRAAPRIVVHGAVAQAGILDLAEAARTGLGGSAVTDLMGGSPAEVSDRYRLGSPQQLIPVPVPVICLHSESDQVVPLDQSKRYVGAATARAASARLIVVDGDHFAPITAGEPAFTASVQAAISLLGR